MSLHNNYCLLTCIDVLNADKTEPITLKCKVFMSMISYAIQSFANANAMQNYGRMKFRYEIE